MDIAYDVSTGAFRKSSPMITFLTIYLGLIAGPRHFELAVPETTARLEIRLDGELRTEVDGPPWVFEVDLGEVPLPHELTAITYGPEGKPTGRAFQRLNVPHPPVEVAIALETEGERVKAARLIWEAAADEALTRVRMRLDGEKIPVEDPSHIPLPPLDLKQTHHLSAEVTFQRRLRTQAAIAFGGSFVDQVDSELTAVVVERLGNGAGEGVPALAEVAGWFQRSGRPLSVFAVEAPPAEVILVRDQASAARLRRLASGFTPKRPGQPNSTGPRRHMMEQRIHNLGIGLEGDDWLRVMATQPKQRPETGKALFRASGNVLELARGLGFGIAGLRIPADERPERLADAVAAAGLEISGGGRRRAVLLVVDPGTEDAGKLDPRQAALYLTAMRVPLAVWTAGDPEAVRRAWGTALDVSKPKRMSAAVAELRNRLDRQLVVWLEGHLLPPEIGLTAEGRRHVAFPRVPLPSPSAPATGAQARTFGPGLGRPSLVPDVGAGLEAGLDLHDRAP